MWTAVFSSDVCAPISSSINVCEDLQMLLSHSQSSFFNVFSENGPRARI